MTGNYICVNGILEVSVIKTTKINQEEDSTENTKPDNNFIFGCGIFFSGFGIFTIHLGCEQYLVFR